MEISRPQCCPRKVPKSNKILTNFALCRLHLSNTNRWTKRSTGVTQNSDHAHWLPRCFKAFNAYGRTYCPSWLARNCSFSWHLSLGSFEKRVNIWKCNTVKAFSRPLIIFQNKGPPQSQQLFGYKNNSKHHWLHYWCWGTRKIRFARKSLWFMGLWGNGPEQWNFSNNWNCASVQSCYERHRMAPQTNISILLMG